MTDDELIEGLAELGLDAANFRVIALLPLIEVAWVDSQVQPAERDLILEAAEAQGLVEGDTLEIVQGWLGARPADATFARGRELLGELMARPGKNGVALPRRAGETILDLCEHVAEAAGGLFGLAFTVSLAEREAIGRIADVVRRD